MVLDLYFCPVLFSETVSQHILCLNYLLSPLILGYKKLYSCSKQQYKYE